MCFAHSKHESVSPSASKPSKWSEGCFSAPSRSLSSSENNSNPKKLANRWTRAEGRRGPVSFTAPAQPSNPVCNIWNFKKRKTNRCKCYPAFTVHGEQSQPSDHAEGDALAHAHDGASCHQVSSRTCRLKLCVHLQSDLRV